MMVQKRASLHTKTVTRLSKGELDKPARRKRSGSTGSSSRIDAQLIDPRIWKTAKKLAAERLAELEGAQSKRPSTAKLRSLMEILGDGEEIIIHNNPNWKEHR